MGYPENQYVNFMVIRRNDKALIYARYMALVVLILVASAIFDSSLPSYLQTGIICACVVLLIYLVIKQRSVKLYYEIGWIMMYPDFVAVRIGDVETEYFADKSTSIALALQGYAGEPIIGTYVQTKDGLNNFISVGNSQRVEKYEVLITNSIKITIMERLLEHYQANGVNVRYTDRSSTDSIESLLMRFLSGLRTLG